MHPLLSRQLQRFFKGHEVPAEGPVAQLLEAVSAAYQAADDERALLDRALTESSNELWERNAALLLDMARRERAESERDAFFRTSADLLCIIDERLHFVQLSPSWTSSMGYAADALAGASVQTIIHPEDGERLAATLAAVRAMLRVNDFEVRVRDAHGTWRWVSWAITWDPNRRLVFGIGRDTTAQREMARELAQAQKLEAVGQLASGVAHEINTPVQFVGDNVAFVRDSFSDLLGYLEAVDGVLTSTQRDSLAEAARKADLDYLRDEVPNSLAEAKDGLRRVAELVRALKEFAHPDKPEMEPADLNRAIERSLVLARGELKHVATVSTDFAALPPVRCHVGSLSQVFLNLLVNAAHAVEERARDEKDPAWERRITVRTQLVGDEVLVSVGDTGTGIPEALRERIFEPFFTTKPLGKGSGQGLPLVRNVVVNRHGGRISLDTEPGRGTTFTLHLPLEQPDHAREAA
ncbi:MAG: sensor histidine kinase [Myxococcota bacterium]